MSDTTSETIHAASPATLTKDDHHLLTAVSGRFTEVVADGRPIFTTDGTDWTEGIWEAFLAEIPSDLRQTYTCNACRTFAERFGGLVTILEDGTQVPVMWYGFAVGPESTFRRAMAALETRVTKSRVSGVFLSKESTWGTPVTGHWNHFAVSPGASTIFHHALLSAGQAMAERKEDRGMLARAIAEFPIEVARNAHQLLSAGDALYRAEKVLGVAAWFLALHEALAAVQDRKKRENLIWRAVALAPPGFAHVRSSMIGTLLEDLAGGMGFEAVKSRFDAKMHPLQYQRPTAPPRDGNIAQAEKAVEALKAAGALDRRFATIGDVTALWVPVAADPKPSNPGTGVFSHLKGSSPGRATAQVEPATQTMTWVKFRDTVLPGAESIECHTGFGGGHSYIQLTTAVDPAAPPILQWDREDRRNPVSWYLHANGSSAAMFNLPADSWAKVAAVTLLPPMWGLEEPRPHWGEGVVFLLEGAKDLRAVGSTRGAGFFVEQLRSEFHPYRRTLEAYAHSAALAGGERDDIAAGLDCRKGRSWEDTVLRVTTKAGRATYKLDRWDVDQLRIPPAEPWLVVFSHRTFEARPAPRSTPDPAGTRLLPEGEAKSVAATLNAALLGGA